MTLFLYALQIQAFPLPLAQEASSASVVFWSLCLFLLVVAGFGVSIFLRKRLSPTEDFHGDGFTLSDLRRLHKSGKISDTEFEQMKQVVLASLSQRTAPPVDALSAGPNMRPPNAPPRPPNQ